MYRTSRASGHRTRRRVVGASVTSLVGLGVASAFFTSSPAGAAPSAVQPPPSPQTHTIEFTDNGPVPSSLKINAGDTVNFVNHLSQSGSIPLLGGILRNVQGAAVEVSGASSSPFTLQTYGSSVPLTYSTPTTANYDAAYKFQLVPILGLGGGTETQEENGTLTVAQVQSATQEPPKQNPVAPPAPPRQPTQPAPPAAGGGNGGGQQNQQPVTGGTGAGANGGGNTGTVRVPSTDEGSVASRIVPPAGSSNREGPRQDSAPTQTSDDTTLTNPAVPELDNGSPTQAITTDVSKTDGLGLPAIIAVVLLSVVTAALVRTLIGHQRAIAA